MAAMFQKKLEQTPDLLEFARQYPDEFPALLNSHVRQKNIGRYSILFQKSEDVISAFDIPQLNKLLDSINSIIHVKHENATLPFYSGWFVYFSYASITAWEKSLNNIQHDKLQPLAVAIRCRSAIIIDHIEQSSWVVADSENGANGLLHIINQPLNHVSQSRNQLKLIADNVESYKDKVNHIKQYITSGDVYQVNLARKWNIEGNADISGLYKSLSKHNPAPFAGLLQIENFAIISSSPERLVKVEKNVIQSRPIAGTRPRSKNKVEDEILLKELKSNLKEQAEHIMLIDLERNDLGRVCEIGSVEVDEFMQIESYAKVHHIVSNVKGNLKANTSYVDVIKATFPGGTITGCPKIRCMQIIDELENYPRGVYTGSMGYITDDGRMDLNILIRTFSLSHGQLSLHAGAGIVYDSIAEKEAQESYFKAEALINSL